MNKIVFILFLLGITLVACNKTNENAVPECIQEQLATFETNQACPAGAKVDKYIFQSQTVYVFNPGSCGADFTTDVFDENCSHLGFLGGITGITDINGVNFYNNAVWEAVVWSN